jgi:hypothetical protein
MPTHSPKQTTSTQTNKKHKPKAHTHTHTHTHTGVRREFMPTTHAHTQMNSVSSTQGSDESLCPLTHTHTTHHVRANTNNTHLARCSSSALRAPLSGQISSLLKVRASPPPVFCQANLSVPPSAAPPQAARRRRRFIGGF